MTCACCAPAKQAPLHDPRWYCSGQPDECFQQGGFHAHPAITVPTLNAAHDLGAAGLDAIFTCGSLWNYGPVYENMEPVFRVIPRCQGGRGAYASGINYSAQPSDARAKGQPAWFIDMECVRSPHRAQPSGSRTGLPPCALIDHAIVLREKRLRKRAAPPYACRSLIVAEGEIRGLRAELTDARALAAAFKREADRAHAKLAAIRRAAE